MRLINRTCVVALLIGSAGTARAAEWPRWRGPDGTGISTEKIADQWPAAGLKKIWSANVGIGFSSPVGRDGTVYLFSQSDAKAVLTAFDADTGKIIWTQARDQKDNFQYPGMRGTPTIDGDFIYTYSCDGDLCCRAVADGKLIWFINVLETTHAEPMKWGQASSPLVDDQNVYVMSGMGGKSSAVAINKTTGALAWGSQAKGAGSYSTIIPVELNKKKCLIALGGESVYCIDPKTGATLWSTPHQTNMAINAATPVYDDGHLFVTSAYGKGSAMLQVTDVAAKKEWENPAVQCRFQAPILDGKMLFCNSEGKMMCLSWPDGKTLWAAKEPGLRLGVGGSIIRDGDKLVTMSERGKLSLLSADATGYKLINQMNLFDYDKVWSTPLIYRGKLYAKGQNELVCLDIGGDAGPKP